MDIELEQMIKEIRKAANVPDDDIEFNRKIGEHVFKYTLNHKFVDEIVNKGLDMVKEIIAVTIGSRLENVIGGRHTNMQPNMQPIAVNNFAVNNIPPDHPILTNNLPDIQEPPDWFWGQLNDAIPEPINE